MKLQIGVKALIRNTKGEYLFLRRTKMISTDSVESSWDIPGGRINPDEALDDALRREIKEETGYAITSTPKLLAAQDIFVDEKDLHVVRLTYAVDEDVEKLALSDEHDAYKWVHEDNIASINTEPYLKEVLNILRD